MKVVLLVDVKGLGRAGDICEVKEGYATNYLIPNKIAILGSSENLAHASSQKRKISEDRAKNQREAMELLRSINNQSIVHKVANTRGSKLKSPIKDTEILNVVEKKTGKREGVTLKFSAKYHIKEIGKHVITFAVVSTKGFNFDKEVVGEFVLDVQS
ncbi:50S ribosomal protein L9 [Candidatus Dojkabacteria bacterium]|nr:50S ribosomal protein L9 [Candidatus Dojkabacteria bacterium]